MGDVRFADKKIINNSVKITLHWSKTNIHREQGRYLQFSQNMAIFFVTNMKHFFYQISKQNIIFM